MVMPGRNIFEAISLRLAPRDVLIVRTDREISTSELVAIKDELRRTNPAWVGSMFVMSTDQEIQKLDEDAARELYGVLHQVFGT